MSRMALVLGFTDKSFTIHFQDPGQEVPPDQIRDAHIVSATWIYLRSKYLVNRSLIMMLDCELTLLLQPDSNPPAYLPSWRISDRKQKNVLRTMQTAIESARFYMVHADGLVEIIHFELMKKVGFEWANCRCRVGLSCGNR